MPGSLGSGEMQPDHDGVLSGVAQLLEDLRVQVAQHERRMGRLMAGRGLPLQGGPRGLPLQGGPPPADGGVSSAGGLDLPPPDYVPRAHPPQDGWPSCMDVDDCGEAGIASIPMSQLRPQTLPKKAPVPDTLRAASAPSALDRASSLSDVPLPDRKVQGRGPTVAWGGSRIQPMIKIKMDAYKQMEKKQNAPVRFRSIFDLSTNRSTRAESYESFVARVVESPIFETLITALIVLSAASLGVQMEWEMHNIMESTPTFFDVVETIFTVAFTAEIVLRISHERLRFLHWTNPVFGWNVFDTGVVSWCLISKAMTFGWVTVANVSFMRLFRVLRIFRAFRLIRVMRLLSDVRIMVAGIVRSFGSLVWALVLLAFIMYLVAVCIMQVVRDELHQRRTGAATGSRGADETVLVELYGSLMRTMYTLYMSISGGIDWGDAAEPLRPISALLVGGFCLYVAFAVFCVLNVITGVFVDNATKNTQRDEETLMQEEVEKRLHWLSEVRRLFHTVDDGSGMMTLKTLHDLVNDIEGQIAFSKIGIEVDSLNVDCVFKMLDFDGSGEVDISEFIAGLEMYTGIARRIDVARLMRETKKVNKQVVQMVKLIEMAHNIV